MRIITYSPGRKICIVARCVAWSAQATRSDRHARWLWRKMAGQRCSTEYYEPRLLSYGCQSGKRALLQPHGPRASARKPTAAIFSGHAISRLASQWCRVCFLDFLRSIVTRNGYRYGCTCSGTQVQESSHESSRPRSCCCSVFGKVSGWPAGKEIDTSRP